MIKTRLKIMGPIGILGLVGLICFCCAPQAGESGGDVVLGDAGAHLEAVLTPLLERLLEDYDLPGLSIGIVKDNEIVYARGFGYRNVDTRAPVDTSTLFHMASISKPFVATAVMQLVEQGGIDLQAPVTTYLPYFKLADERYTDITIQQMLSHVSGMPDVQDYEWDNPVYDEGALERYVRSIAELKMRFDPGARFAYSNMAFECLGDVIAKVSGMSFADYVKKHILDQAGMVDSTFLKPEGLPENWASGHLRTIKTIAWEGYPYNRMHGPSSTLHSNAQEMCRWAIINMQRGTSGGKIILEASSYDQLWKPRQEIGKTGTSQAVGLSWFLGEHRGERAVSHGGGDTGFSSYLIMLPDKGAAVAVMINYLPAPAAYVAGAALDILLGFEPGDFKPPASVPMLRAYAEGGKEAAVALWESLQKDHAEEYNFGQQQMFYMAAMALELDRVEEGEEVIRLLLDIVPAAALKSARGFILGFQKTHPDNRTAARMLEIMNGN